MENLPEEDVYLIYLLFFEEVTVKEAAQLCGESAGVHIIWGSDAHHVSEMLLSDQEFQYLSSVYEFDFSKVINNKPDDLLTLLYNRRQGK